MSSDAIRAYARAMGKVAGALTELGHVYRDEWRAFRMHFATDRRPIDGFVSYFAYQQTRCVVCGQGREDIYGKYCSESCREIDAEMQAHG
jgi:hypothetical protein